MPEPLSHQQLPCREKEEAVGMMTAAVAIVIPLSMA